MAQQSNEFAGAFKAETQNELARHAGDAPRSFQGLPGGVSGVAKLHKLEFKQYGSDTKQKKADGSSAAGEWFFQGTGICMTPASVMTPNGEIKIAGEQTRPMAIAICDIKVGQGPTSKVRTEWEQVRRVMDELVLLSGNQYLFCNNNDPKQPKQVTKGLLKQVADALVAESLRRAQASGGQGGIFFRYDTTQAKATLLQPNPMVFENWRGIKGVENWTPPNFAAAAVQDSNVAPAAPASPPPSPAQAAASPVQQPAPAAPIAESVDEVERLFRLAIGDVSLPSTADAQQALAKMCVANGWAMEEIDNEKTTWDDMKRMAQERKPAPHANGAPAGPRKGDTVTYSKVPFNDGGRWRNSRVQITEVNPDGTFDLLNLDDGRSTYQRVPAADTAPA